MIRYVIRRLIQSIPTLFGITVLSYLLMSAAPGGPTELLLAGPKVTPQQREKLRVQMGVNDPWIVQYGRWLLGDDWLRWDNNGDGIADGSFLLNLDADNDGVPEPPGKSRGVLRGDFGQSFFARRPSLDLIFERIPATLELGITSLVVSLVIGVPIGILAAVKRGKLFDNMTRIMAVIFSAIPVFWLGLIVILIFGSWLRVLPMGSRCPVSLTAECPPIYLRLNYLLLPTIVLATGGIAGFSRYMRASMLDVISQDYMRTAKAKGLSLRTVWFKHGARNSMIPLATFLGPAIAGVLGGAPITETIFSWPGLGRLGVESVLKQDYPVVMATVIFAAVATVLGFILSDILYGLIDPRIRYD